MFELTVSDNIGQTAKDTTQVSVYEPYAVPEAKAGDDKIIRLPVVTTAVLNNNKNSFVAVLNFKK